MSEIYDPNNSFNFEDVILTKPTSAPGGNYFIRFLKNDNPLYIQPPKCIAKSGIIKTGKKMYCDLQFSNENDSFIHWMENLENISQKKIFENREKWFETDLEMHDIENSFASPLKIFKSGKYYILRVSIPTILGKCVAKIYDENEHEMAISDVKENANIMVILEIQGIKCSARSFSIDIELKQLLIMKPKNLFDKCILVTQDVSEQRMNNYTRPDVAGSAATERIEEVTLNMEGNKSIETFNEVNDTELSIRDDADGMCPVAALPATSGLNREHSTLDDVDIMATEPIVNISDNAVNNITCENALLNENNSMLVCNPSEIVILDDIEREQTELEEINLDICDFSEEDVVHLKTRNEVYYEMYTEALRKAKIARDLALSNYLEAKRIKNTYLLLEKDTEDTSEFDEET